MRILMLPRYGRSGASSRYRTYNYIPQLEGDGFTCESHAMVDDRYLSNRYSGRLISPLYVARSCARRLVKIVTSNTCDILWLEKEAFPYLPGWFESALLKPKAPYVVDYDDAQFHAYDEHGSRVIRKVLGRKIDRVMHDAALVVAGNQYIAERARTSGCERVEILPTVVDLTNYPVVPRPDHEVFTIGWIGTPMTSRLLKLVRPALEHVCRNGNARVLAIGAGDLDLGAVPLEIRPWSEETEVADLQRIDVGIMPLSDSPWERGKCGLKLIQYMACGRPVVGSPVGVNGLLISDGVNGYKATTHQEWVDALLALLEEPDARIRMGAAGRRLVENSYCLQVTAPILAGFFRSIQ